MTQENSTLETRENGFYPDIEMHYTKGILKLLDLYQTLKNSNQHSIEFLESYSPIEKTNNS